MKCPECGTKLEVKNNFLYQTVETICPACCKTISLRDMTLEEVKKEVRPIKTVDNLLSTDDAEVWANDFCHRKEKNNWTIDDIDFGLMLGWFANAMTAAEFDHTVIQCPKCSHLKFSIVCGEGHIMYLKCCTCDQLREFDMEEA